MEAELAELRARARVGPATDISDLRRALAGDAARAHESVVADLEQVVDLVGTAWRATGEQIAAISSQLAAIAGQVAELRAMAEDARQAMRGARVEVRLGAPLSDGAQPPPPRRT